MKHISMPKMTIGMDLGDRWSHLCAVDSHGTIKDRQRIRTTQEGITEAFARQKRCRVIIEAGTHSPWVYRLLLELKHEVIVANPRQLKLIYKDARKNDRLDAEYLARLGRMDSALLHPIHHRNEETQKDRALLNARGALVRVRSTLVNHIRGAVKSLGHRVPLSSTESFTKKARQLPVDLLPIINPLLEQIDLLTKQIAVYDRQVGQMVKVKYPEAQRVSQPAGVGPITALTYVLTIEDPSRFPKSRDVGPYLGLVPRRNDSGDQSPQLRITKNGDVYLRSLLVGAAHYIMGPFGPDCDLRRYGEAIATRGGKNAKKRAVVAVARKLAVLMHRLWVTGEAYGPLHNSQDRDKTAA